VAKKKAYEKPERNDESAMWKEYYKIYKKLLAEKRLGL
jgi:hypothetical protein